MPRLAIRSAVWILTLLFRLAVAENKTCPEQNVRLLDSQENKLAYSLTGSFWKQRPSRGNESIETVGFPNKILLRAARNLDFEESYKNASANGRTLMDYNGPVIMEDLDNMSDQDFASRVRVKRNEPIVRRRSSRSIKSIDLFPQNSRHKINETNVFFDSTLEGSRSDHENRSNVIMDIVAAHLRRKRGIVSKSGYRRKRVKGNAGHSKHNVEMKKGKKNGVSKTVSSQQPEKKKTSKSNSKEKSKNNREIGRPARMIESRIKKRESENSDLNTNIDIANVEKAGDLVSQKENASLMNIGNLAEQRNESSIILPFVHTGRAELRVRIEKLPANESSFINPNYSGMDRTVGTSPCSIRLPKYNASDEIPNINRMNLKFAPNFDSGKGKVNNLTVEITLKKLNYGNNPSVLEINDPKNTSFYDVDSHPVESNESENEDDQNMKDDEKYDRTNEMSEGSTDEKSRAKRNQEITSKRYPRNDKNTKESRRFKDAEQGTSIEDTKRGKTKYKMTRGNRTVRSIEEIKNLAEKLIIKINELQVYVSNHNETLYARDSCLGEDGEINEERPRISLEKKVSSSKLAKNVTKHQRFVKEATLAGKRASQMRSGGSRFARGEYRTRRRSRRKWGRWMDWSSCSVTCGKGRQIRWRHCLHDCNDAETEMEEKACQLPACPPSKFLGIF